MVPRTGMWCILGVRSGRAQQKGEGVCGSLAQVILVHQFSLTVALLWDLGKSLLFLICKVRNDSISVMSEYIPDIKHCKRGKQYYFVWGFKMERRNFWNRSEEG